MPLLKHFVIFFKTYMTGLTKSKTIEKFRPPLFSIVHLRQCKIENAACSVMYVLQGRTKDVCVCTYVSICLLFSQFLPIWGCHVGAWYSFEGRLKG